MSYRNHIKSRDFKNSKVITYQILQKESNILLQIIMPIAYINFRCTALFCESFGRYKLTLDAFTLNKARDESNQLLLLKFSKLQWISMITKEE